LSSFSMYPNPVSTELRYEFFALQSGNIEVSITDLNGKLVVSEQVTANTGNNTGVIDVSGLSSGNYNFTITEGNNSVTEKIVVN